MTDLSQLVWRKSSRSGGNGGACLEMASQPGRVFIRDSQHPHSPVLAVPAADWRALLNTLDQP